jgi:Tfp pilus assembly protein PilF
MMGEAELHLGNQNSAEKYFENALNMKPDHLPAHFTMAQLRLKQVNKARMPPAIHFDIFARS